MSNLQNINSSKPKVTHILRSFDNLTPDNFLKVSQTCQKKSVYSIIGRSTRHSIQQSISSTFFARIFCTNFLPKLKRKKKKLPKQHTYEKFVPKNIDEIDTKSSSIHIIISFRRLVSSE